MKGAVIGSNGFVTGFDSSGSSSGEPHTIGSDKSSDQYICPKGHITTDMHIDVRRVPNAVAERTSFCGVCYAEWLSKEFPVAKLLPPG